MVEGVDRAREEFFSEAQELIEGLSRSLLNMDEVHATGVEDPAVVNEAFRAVHTLKSLAAIFGYKAMGTLSHRLEDALDELRLGRLPLTRDFIDVLFQAVELYWQLLSHDKDSKESDGPRIDGVLSRLASMTSAASASSPKDLEFDAALLSVLTEYEEHRLRTCVSQGLSLFKIRVSFDLATIDKELEAIKAKAKPLGEVITYLPTGGMTSADAIELDILLAAGADLEILRQELGSSSVSIDRVSKTSEAPDNPDTVVPAGPASIHGTAPPKSLATHLHAPSASNAPNAVMRSVSQSVRVDIRKLDALMNAVGELAIVKSALSRIGERLRQEGNKALGGELHRLHRNFDRRLGELQTGILEVRMVPLSQMFDRLTGVVRQISRDLGKEIRLVITGGDTEIDKLIVEELSDPLMHIVRNAIDHGIEAGRDRMAIGKPEIGTIALNAFQKGNHVVLEVEDDGGGVNEKSLIQRAVEMKKLSQDEAKDLSRGEVLNLIFLPGLSTRDTVDDLSGRGVGMDVVKTNIGKLGGVIDLQSERNIGTKITVTLPITLAIVSALLIRTAGRTFAMPLNAVSEALLLDEASVRVIDGREAMTLRGVTLPLCKLDQFFGFSNDQPRPRRRFVVVANIGARRLGLAVDELMGQQDIVIKALGRSLRSVRGFSGATELGDHKVALVLDVASIIEETLMGVETRELRGLSYA
jgi:two-component system, chemotaxis family, sensor kinase CheA